MVCLVTKHMLQHRHPALSQMTHPTTDDAAFHWHKHGATDDTCSHTHAPTLNPKPTSQEPCCALQGKTLIGPAFAPTMIPDPVVPQQPSVRTECYAHAEDRPAELRAAAQSLQVTAASMQQSLHQLAMLLLKPKVCASASSWPIARILRSWHETPVSEPNHQLARLLLTCKGSTLAPSGPPPVQSLCGWHGTPEMSHAAAAGMPQSLHQLVLLLKPEAGASRPWQSLGQRS